MKLVKSLLGFGICGPLLIILTTALPNEILGSTLIGLIDRLTEYLPIALASWMIFIVIIQISESLLVSMWSQKPPVLLKVFPVWAAAVAFASYYVVLDAARRLCSLAFESEILQFACSAKLDPSIFQLLIYGVVCGGIPAFFFRLRLGKPSVRGGPNQITNKLYRLADQAKKLWWTLPILITLVIFLLFFNGYFPLKGDDLEERGQFGDSFGVLNSLFSGLAFGGLIITLLYQQKQISHQENESTTRREFEETQHYEGVFYKLLSIYSKTLDEVTSNKGDLIGRNVLRGSIDRVYSSLRSHNVNAISQVLQSKYEKNELSKEEALLIDYVYFRNFKILSVEIERQKRLVQTFKLLLRHTIRSLPEHLDGKPYFDLIKSQLNHTEASYFFLVALTFEDEMDFRELIKEADLFEKIANTKVIRVHEMMYKDFWGIDIRQHKIKQRLPMGRKRIDQAIRAFESSSQDKPSTSLRRYTSVKVRMNTSTSTDVTIDEPASNQENFDCT